MGDRLADLGPLDDDGGDVERGPDVSDQFMSDFFEEVGAIKQSMSTIRNNIDAIEEGHAQYIAAVTEEVAKERAAELDAITDETQEAFQLVQQKLKKMRAENDKLQQSGSSEARIRNNMHNTLTKKYVDLMARCRDVQENCKQQQKKRITEGVLIVNPDATQEDIERAIESGETTEMFAKHFLAGKYSQEATDALNYVQAKHKRIQHLQESIEALHQLFLDMAVLVEAQGELINQIEHNVQRSHHDTTKAVDQLRSAGKVQQKNRKKMCIILVLVIGLMLCIVGPILGAVLGGG